MGILSTLVAYGLYEISIRDMPISETAAYNYLSPILTIPFSYLLLGEKVTLWFIIGGLVIGFGVYLSEKKAKI